MTDTVTISQTFTLTVDDISTYAGNDVYYWGEAEFSTDTYGLLVREHENDEADPIFVSWQTLREAFVQCVKNEDKNGERLMGYPHEYFLNAVRDAEDGVPDWGHIDGTASDIWLQVAAFGQIVYG